MSTLNTYNLKSPDSASTNLALDASGNVAIQAGSASAPSIYVTGDANTGIYSPGADQVAVTTGGSARLYINSSGNVGIGSTSVSGGQVVINSTLDASNKQLVLRDATNGWARKIGVDSSNNMGFYDGDTERMRIDSSGRLLVGTSSALNVEPFVAAQVQTEARYGYASIYRGNDAGGPAFYFIKSRAASAVTVVQSGDVLGEIRFQGADGGDYETPGGMIRCEVDGTPGANDMPGRLVFSTTSDSASSPTERVRIDSSGYFKASTDGTYIAGSGHQFKATSDDVTIRFNASNGSFSSILLQPWAKRNSTNGSFRYIGCYNEDGSNYRLNVADSGNVTNVNNSYGAISDIKLKENVVDASSQWQDLKSLKVRNYNFKEETGQSTHKQIGLIAQEAELVCPGLVIEEQDLDGDGNSLGTATKTINYSVLYMKAVKALQEAMERIETLEASNVDLLARVSVLEQG